MNPGRNPHRYGLGGHRNRVQQTLKDHLNRVPGIERVRFETSRTGIDYQVVVDIDIDIFAHGVITAESARVQLNWWPQLSDPDWFEFHYIDPTDYNCGWHRHHNTHVDGLDHFQEYLPTSDETHYEPVTFEYDNPAGLVWEIIDDRLIQQVTEQY
jgi:hypothetical protein